ncbi:hypothetical protein VNO77_22860 [Canavalia gladiata]|uniref:Uncharacterized protein n=1 Tax=Canavalia gladiata TaxID=3824 RepID=A0AAN9L4B2_CANGL
MKFPSRRPFLILSLQSSSNPFPIFQSKNKARVPLGSQILQTPVNSRLVTLILNPSDNPGINRRHACWVVLSRFANRKFHKGSTPFTVITNPISSWDLNNLMFTRHARHTLSP